MEAEIAPQIYIRSMALNMISFRVSVGLQSRVHTEAGPYCYRGTEDLSWPYHARNYNMREPSGTWLWRLTKMLNVWILSSRCLIEVL